VPPLDLARARVSPAGAAGRHDLEAGRLRLEMYYDGRPIYRFGVTKVYADTGELVPGLDRAGAIRLVQAWLPQHAATVKYDGYLVDSDQWTLYNDQRAAMPLHRIAVGDPAGTHYYVSETTGEPTMKTDRRGRFWGYISAVLHWTYFTSLRRNGPLWQQLVAWGSLVGALMCVLGMVVGFIRVRVKERYRLRSGPSHSPYAGWMKWHHYTGLVFGLVTITWAFSGAMSLGRPFPSLRNRPTTPAQRTAVAGTPLDLQQLTLERLRGSLEAVAPYFRPKEIDVVQFRGAPYVLAYRPPPPYSYDQEIGANEERYEPRREHLVVPALAPWRGAFRRFSDDSMWNVAKAAMPGAPMQDAEWLREYDAYYYDKDGNKPLPVLRVRYADADSTWLYLDPHLGTMTKQDRGARWNRWLYHGLHNLDFPFLYYTRPLWDIVVIVLSLGGLALSATTLVPSYRRLARHVRHATQVVVAARPRRRPLPSSVLGSPNSTGTP
jgi:PepSY-associated TM region